MVISQFVLPSTLVTIKELILNILFDPAGLFTTAAVEVVTACPTTLPKIEVTFTMFGFAITIPYPKTIAIAMALPVVTPLGAGA
jgi:hypothetical protein